MEEGWKGKCPNVGQKEKCGFVIKLTPNDIKINKVAHIKNTHQTFICKLQEYKFKRHK